MLQFIVKDVGGGLLLGGKIFDDFDAADDAIAEYFDEQGLEYDDEREHYYITLYSVDGVIL